MKLDKFMSMREVARVANVDQMTMRRRIHYLDKREGGVLVSDPTTGRRVVDVARLLSLCDDFFGKHVATPSEVEGLRTELLALRGVVRELRARVRKLEEGRAQG